MYVFVHVDIICYLKAIWFQYFDQIDFHRMDFIYIYTIKCIYVWRSCLIWFDSKRLFHIFVIRWLGFSFRFLARSICLPSHYAYIHKLEIFRARTATETSTHLKYYILTVVASHSAKEREKLNKKKRWVTNEQKEKWNHNLKAFSLIWHHWSSISTGFRAKVTSSQFCSQKGIVVVVVVIFIRIFSIAFISLLYISMSISDWVCSIFVALLTKHHIFPHTYALHTQALP